LLFNGTLEGAVSIAVFRKTNVRMNKLFDQSFSSICEMILYTSGLNSLTKIVMSIVPAASTYSDVVHEKVSGFPRSFGRNFNPHHVEWLTT
jgi:hypothetical protein